MYCKYCRNVIPDGVNVCPKCGAGVVRPENNVNNNTNNNLTEPNNNERFVNNIQNTIINNIPSQPSYDNSSSKGSSKLPVVLLIIILIVLAIIFVPKYLNKSDNGSGSTTSNTENGSQTEKENNAANNNILYYVDRNQVDENGNQILKGFLDIGTLKVGDELELYDKNLEFYTDQRTKVKVTKIVVDGKEVQSLDNDKYSDVYINTLLPDYGNTYHAYMIATPNFLKKTNKVEVDADIQIQAFHPMWPIHSDYSIFNNSNNEIEFTFSVTRHMGNRINGNMNISISENEFNKYIDDYKDIKTTATIEFSEDVYMIEGTYISYEEYGIEPDVNTRMGRGIVTKIY